LFIVSAVSLEPGQGEDVVIRVDKAPGEKCERCWNRSVDIGSDPEYPEFCPRCAEVVKEMSR
jgi:isoleucyl-tRNA synthetase